MGCGMSKNVHAVHCPSAGNQTSPLLVDDRLDERGEEAPDDEGGGYHRPQLPAPPHREHDGRHEEGDLEQGEAPLGRLVDDRYVGRELWRRRIHLGENVHEHQGHLVIMRGGLM